MAVDRWGNLWPDGFSLSAQPSIPGLGLLGGGGTYYWNPGAPDAPSVTVTGTASAGPEVMSFGPGIGAHLVFLRKGMTSADTLGYGTAGNVSTLLPSVTVNASIPDKNHIPQLDKAKVSSIEAGVSTSIGASAAGTYTWTPQQVADGIANLLRPITPAMGPNDELSPFERRLQSSQATVGSNGAPPVGYLSSPFQKQPGGGQNPLGNGMAGWQSSAGGFDPQDPTRWNLSEERPGGLPGLL